MYEWVVSHVWVSGVTYIRESSHITASLPKGNRVNLGPRLIGLWHVHPAGMCFSVCLRMSLFVSVCLCVSVCLWVSPRLIGSCGTCTQQVFASVSVYLCESSCVSLCVSVCLCMSLYISVYLCVSLCVSVCQCVCGCPCLSFQYVCVSTCLCSMCVSMSQCCCYQKSPKFYEKSPIFYLQSPIFYEKSP